MKAWQILGVSALILNGLALLALLFVGHPELVKSVLAGAIIPVLISGGLLLWAEYSKTNDAQNLQKINIVGFFFKVILLGIWSAILVKAGTLDNVTFIVTLVINFLAWHGVEAYYWPLFMARSAQKTGENS
ncbi:MAG: hypothetical protein HN995_03195 [Candidatus Marinimicrobia bacterium]|jgi:hypothetical protein|nr:hypothetical protein [Candidatus Neomarinimicrobiota bacterium]MBT3575224.1 hypothetical protein [Candidatus Neomarinimicrobiota bacterium]MBT3680844.1 hypothetical protein [Candidatus Neomarinimicrobiota bacterium]MBT3951382.1 hypothetical protein [Candidatus Neomarinimicrobiota bacterium]MBT4252814.1 hypothetical protein [Candidatus Neomarinimicrobiota bacterium]